MKSSDGDTRLDYKTGPPPRHGGHAGFARQLTLEAAILRVGRFSGYSARQLGGANWFYVGR